MTAALRCAGVEGVPNELDRETPYDELWGRDDFLFGQACGFDVLFTSPERLRIVATPRYRARGRRGSTYRSFVLVRNSSRVENLTGLRGSRLAINSLTSHSGAMSLLALVHDGRATRPFFSHIRLSGSHEASLHDLVTGRVDAVAVDCVTHALLARYRPRALTGTRILLETAEAPAPPFVTRKSAPDALVGALRDALHESLTRGVGRPLLLEDADVLPLDAYRVLVEPARIATTALEDHGIAPASLSAGAECPSGRR